MESGDGPWPTPTTTVSPRWTRASSTSRSDPTVHMHVGAVALFEPGPLATRRGRHRHRSHPRRRGVEPRREPALPAEARAHPAGRLPGLGRRRALQPALPRAPHRAAAARARCASSSAWSAASLSQKLDRSKPLWEMWFVEGLEDGRFALIAKAHHCMVDGISGFDLLARMMRPDPDPTDRAAPRWIPRPAPAAAAAPGGRGCPPRRPALRRWRARACARSPRRARVAGPPPRRLRARSWRRSPPTCSPAIADAAQRGDRPLPALRLDALRPRRREGGEAAPRRHRQRRRARLRGRRHPGASCASAASGSTSISFRAMVPVSVRTTGRARPRGQPRRQPGRAAARRRAPTRGRSPGAGRGDDPAS